METTAVLGVGVAVAAAVRSTWSPCGLSMLSTITPMAERGRGHRFGATAAWFVGGAVAGGAGLGALAAVLAGVVAASGLAATARLVVAALVCLAAALIDAGAFGPVIPVFRRQVDDRWLARYRPWLYGAGFGAQIGLGIATYIMTAGLFSLLVLAAAGASPVDAWAIGIVFGTVRGLAILLGRGITSPAALARFHSSFDRWREPVRWGGAAAQVAAAGVALAALAGSPPPLLAGITVPAGAVVVALATRVAGIGTAVRSEDPSAGAAEAASIPAVAAAR